MKPDSKAILAAVVLVALGGWYASRKLSAAGAAIGNVAAGAGRAMVAAGEWTVQNLNPAADSNIVYRAAGAVTGAAAGREETFGGWLRSITSNDDARVSAMLEGPGTGTYNSTLQRQAAVSDLRQIDRIMERQAASDAMYTGRW